MLSPTNPSAIVLARGSVLASFRRKSRVKGISLFLRRVIDSFEQLSLSNRVFVLRHDNRTPEKLINLYLSIVERVI